MTDRTESKERANGDNLVGFRLMASVCGKQSRNPTVCYHPDNPGSLGHFGGGKCARSACPVWRYLQKANAEAHGRRSGTVQPLVGNSGGHNAQ